MQTSATAFWVPKAGLRPDEWEDAFSFDEERGRFSVADGASESSFAGEWARLLAERFVADPPDAERLPEWLKPLQAEWGRRRKGQALAWYAEEKARDGAFSSLLGLGVDAAAGLWSSLAIGDSCLFGVREERIVHAFPLSHSSQFHNRPLLLSSVARANGRVWQAVRQDTGTCGPGDVFLLMTDALAAWFLAEAEMRRRPWAALRKVASQEEFGRFLDLLRAGGAVRNDDVTLIQVEVR